jgi:PII-like signaling protein
MLQAQIFIDLEEVKGSLSLHDFIMQFLSEQDIAGATSFQGYTGFGASHKIKRPNEIFSFDEPPAMITFIDQDDKVRAALTNLRREVKSGVIILHHVETF